MRYLLLSYLQVSQDLLLLLVRKHSQLLVADLVHVVLKNAAAVVRTAKESFEPLIDRVYRQVVRGLLRAAHSLLDEERRLRVDSHLGTRIRRVRGPGRQRLLVERGPLRRG